VRAPVREHAWPQSVSAQLASSLERGAHELGVALAPAQITTLLDFLALLGHWNRAYNLTAVREPLQMVSRHLLDSLSIAPFVHGKTLLDVGSGAGLPGLVLAVAIPRLEVTLLDPALKRTRFLAHVIRELGLENVVVERARIEDFSPGRRFDTITSRATVALDVLIDATLPLLGDDGRVVAMLGKCPQTGAPAVHAHWQLRIEPLKVPGVDAARHAALISRTQS
jgi:16S rRNA (guanine527-N7)-methyltransferase